MSNTIYASFADADLAEKAAGALLDHGVRPEDLSVVRSEADLVSDSHTTTAYGTTTEGVGDVRWSEPTDINRPSDYTAVQPNIDNPGGFSGGHAFEELSEMTTVDNTGEVNPPSAGYGTTHERIVMANEEDLVVPHVHHDPEAVAEHGITTTTGADAGAGAIKGTAVGIGVGALAAIASLFVPGVGLVLGGGALAAALGGVAASAGAGAAAGAVAGFLKDQGVDEQLAADYEHTIRNGGALLSVNSPSGDCDEVRIREILAKYGANNLNAYDRRGYAA